MSEPVTQLGADDEKELHTNTTDQPISFLAEEIINACKDRMGSFVGGIITGPPRVGKTVYAIKVMRDVFRTLHPELDKEKVYQMAIDHLFLKINGFLKLTSEKQRYMKAMLPQIDWSQRIPAGTLDDASIYAGAELYFQDQDLYTAMQGTMTTIGTAYSSILITSPTHEALTKCIREYYDYYIIKITHTSSDDSLATIQEWYKRPRTNKRALRKVAEDVFTRHIPKKIYAKYLGPRIDMGVESMDYLLSRSETKMKPQPRETSVKTSTVVDPALKELVEKTVEARMARKKRKAWTTLPAPPAPAQNQPNT